MLHEYKLRSFTVDLKPMKTKYTEPRIIDLHTQVYCKVYVCAPSREKVALDLFQFFFSRKNKKKRKK